MAESSSGQASGCLASIVGQAIGWPAAFYIAWTLASKVGGFGSVVVFFAVVAFVGPILTYLICLPLAIAFATLEYLAAPPGHATDDETD
jgi:hypothetical protein